MQILKQRKSRKLNGDKIKSLIPSWPYRQLQKYCKRRWRSLQGTQKKRHTTTEPLKNPSLTKCSVAILTKIPQIYTQTLISKQLDAFLTHNKKKPRIFRRVFTKATSATMPAGKEGSGDGGGGSTNAAGRTTFRPPWVKEGPNPLPVPAAPWTLKNVRRGSNNTEEASPAIQSKYWRLLFKKMAVVGPVGSPDLATTSIRTK